MAWLPDGEKNFEDIFIRFGATHERDRQTDRHRVPAYTALMRAVKIVSHLTTRSTSIADKPLSLTNRAMPVCKVVEVLQHFFVRIRRQEVHQRLQWVTLSFVNTEV